MCASGPLMNNSMVLGELEHGLYTLNPEFTSSVTNQADTSVISSLHSSFSAIESAKLWHLRLGHISFNKIKNLDDSIDVQGCLAENICLSYS